MATSRQNKLKPLGQHQSSWIWGRHLIWETLQADRWPVLELWLAEDLFQTSSDPGTDASRAEGDSPAPPPKIKLQLPPPAANTLAASPPTVGLSADGETRDILRLAAANHIPVHWVSRKSLVGKCRGEDHQGFAARMAEFPYQTWETTWNPAVRWPLYVILDRIQDPFNFGTMLRSAEIFGAQGALIGTTEQTSVTSQVARSSVGAVNRLPIIQTADLIQQSQVLRQRGIQLIGASEKAEMPLWEVDLRQPLAVLIGNENKGLSPALASQCETLVRIPQQGQLNSLNAAAALAIFCYEIRRQQTASAP